MQSGAKPAGFWTFVALTWRSVLHAMLRAPLVFAGSFVAVAAIGVGIFYLDRMIEHLPSSNWILRQAGWLAPALAALVKAVLISLALAPVALTVHRLVLADDTALHGVGRYAAWLFGFLIFWKAVQIPTLVFGAGSFALDWLAVGIVGSVMLRSALLFPALAADVPAASIKERVEAGWRLATGHLRKLFGVWFISALPLIIVMVVLSRRAVAPADAVVQVAKPALGIGRAVIGAAVTVMMVSVSAAVTSWVYLWALDHPSEPVKP